MRREQMWKSVRLIGDIPALSYTYPTSQCSRVYEKEYKVNMELGRDINKVFGLKNIMKGMWNGSLALEQRFMGSYW
ncbi:unnamed protein product [Caenorhabditis nigoni]